MQVVWLDPVCGHLLALLAFGSILGMFLPDTTKWLPTALDTISQITLATEVQPKSQAPLSLETLGPAPIPKAGITAGWSGWARWPEPGLHAYLGAEAGGHSQTMWAGTGEASLL